MLTYNYLFSFINFTINNYVTSEFDKLYFSVINEKSKGLWHNIRKKKGNPSSKWKNDPKYRKQMKDKQKKYLQKKVYMILLDLVY